VTRATKDDYTMVGITTHVSDLAKGLIDKRTKESYMNIMIDNNGKVLK
jgi:hypothetical protein